MRTTRYNDSTIGKVVSMRCRRSPTNRNVVVIDTEKLDQVYVYDYAEIDDVMTFLQDVMNIDIAASQQSPITFKLVNHASTGDIYQITHEEDGDRDDFHAFFAPLGNEA
ncbi:MAG: hypothetical protein ACYDCO_24160 [Armatimonadota bacterium]